MVLDAGWGAVDPSTVIDLTTQEPRLVRAGAGMDLLEQTFGMRRPLEADE